MAFKSIRHSVAAAAAAKLLQSCPTLCDPIDSNPPGSPAPGILQARTLEWVAISLFNAWNWKVKVKLLSRVWLFATPWTAAHQAPPSMGFSRQEYWSGVPLPSLRHSVTSLKCKQESEPPETWTAVSRALDLRDHQEHYHSSSVQFSRSVVSDSLRPHESQHARPTCPSPTPRVYPNSCPSSLWCHPAISSSAIPFSSFPQSLPASGSFPMSQLFTWGGQSTGVSDSALVLPVNIQDWSPLGWTGWISLQSKGLSRVFSNAIVQKYQFLGAQPSSQSNSHIHTWLLEKP